MVHFETDFFEKCVMLNPFQHPTMDFCTKIYGM